MSYGYHRAEVLGALASILLIWGLLIWLVIEAADRLVHEEDIDGTVMLITAVIGLACNLVNIFVLE
jgi:zinc transporter 2